MRWKRWIGFAFICILVVSMIPTGLADDDDDRSERSSRNHEEEDDDEDYWDLSDDFEDDDYDDDRLERPSYEIVYVQEETVPPTVEVANQISKDDLNETINLTNMSLFDYNITYYNRSKLSAYQLKDPELLKGSNTSFHEFYNDEVQKKGTNWFFKVMEWLRVI